MTKARAKYRCKTCGREFEATAIKANRRDADSWEEWAAEHIRECQDCRQERIEAERQAESEKAAADARGKGYPSLTGTEKQIAWAERIRAEFVREWDGFIQATKDQHKDANTNKAEAFKAWMLSKDRAAFWIDNRLELDTSPAMIWRIFRDRFSKEQGGATG